jgi:large subunit ribosomal protein L10e
MGKKSWTASYTRKEYIRSIPQQAIRRFTSGDATGDFDLAVSLVTSTNVELSSKALEAARVTANRQLIKALGEGAFRLEVVPYPHEVVREHKFMGFAGADRLSQGMKLAFGRPRCRAARVPTGQAVLMVSVDEPALTVVKQALKQASKKLPIKYNITIEAA